jgi:hypothetical protein
MFMASTLSALAKEFKKLSSTLDVSDDYKAFYTTPQHDGSPHIEIGSDGFRFVVTERGHELERETGLSADEVLYLLLEGQPWQWQHSMS